MPSSINIWRLSLIPEKAIDENRAKRQKETTFVERKQKRLRTSFFVFLTSSLAGAKSSTVVVVQLAGECTGFHVLCKCPPERKIPETEVGFIKDQREKLGLLGGKMTLEGKDVKGARLEKNREEKEEKKAMKEMKRAEAAAKVDENIKRKRASDNKMATLDEANDNFDNLDVGNNDFEYKEHKETLIGRR